MAKGKSKKPSKSGAIKAYLTKHTSAGPTEVSSALKKQGINVTPAYVSTIKALSKRAASNGTRRHGTATLGDAVSLAQLVEAGRFAKQVGGIDAAIGLLQSLGKLMR
jgi:hypothetical protein